MKQMPSTLPFLEKVQSALPPVEDMLYVVGQVLFVVGALAGMYMLLMMSLPRAGFFGIGARPAGVTLEGLFSALWIMLHHVALGLICQGVSQGLRALKVQSGESEHGSGAQAEPG